MRGHGLSLGVIPANSFFDTHPSIQNTHCVSRTDAIASKPVYPSVLFVSTDVRVCVGFVK